MEVVYQELIRFNYEANLLYTQGILSQNHIVSQSTTDGPFVLLVKPEDHQKAITLINTLDIDESDVSEDNDGYIAGYEEWADKRFVNGYFTGGRIPCWMFDKHYAKWFGPVNVITGLFLLYTLTTDAFNISDILIQLLFCIIYIICGVFLTIRGFTQ